MTPHIALQWKQLGIRTTLVTISTSTLWHIRNMSCVTVNSWNSWHWDSYAIMWTFNEQDTLFSSTSHCDNAIIYPRLLAVSLITEFHSLKSAIILKLVKIRNSKNKNQVAIPCCRCVDRWLWAWLASVSTLYWRFAVWL